MKYSDLPLKEKQTINGKIAQFMDVYIRKNQVWLPEEMLNAFLADISQQHHSGYWYNSIDPVRSNIIKNSLTWILSIEGQAHIMRMIVVKHDKDKDIAVRENPLAERIRFGDWPDFFFDISYGLKGKSGHDRMTTEELRKVDTIPWTLLHVNHELQKKYGKDLIEIYKKIPFNHYELDFHSFWFKNFYADEFPALLPRINSFRSQFGYIEYNGKMFKDFKDTGLDWYEPNIHFRRFKYDYLLINTKMQRSCFIDIITDTFPTTKEDKKLKSLKREAAYDNQLDYLTVKQSSVKGDLAKCYESLSVYLS